MIGFEIAILFLLQVVSGIFSMSETAIIAARKSRLRQMAERGSTGAQSAIEIAEEPNRFLSTVQIFITLIGIVGGAIGGATLTEEVARLLQGTFLEAQGEAIGLVVIILFTTYLSLVIGELVPKRLALRLPEQIAARVSQPMNVLSRLTSPIVKLLSVSTNAVLSLLGMRNATDEVVTSEDIEAMVQEGVATGHIEPFEQRMLAGVFRLDDVQIASFLTPRVDLAWLDVQDDEETTKRTLLERHYSRYPVCDGGLSNPIGVVETAHILVTVLTGAPLDLRTLTRPTLILPERVTAATALTQFREQGARLAFVIDEYGGWEGIITQGDIIDAITSAPDVQRADGSYLLDGMTSIDEVKTLLGVKEVPGEGDRFQLLSGFIMAQLDAIPNEGDAFEWSSFRFEVIDMDDRRIDKVLISRLSTPEQIEDAQRAEDANANA